MKIVILSGGIGYRLKDETEFKPKPMVLIGNKPMLWHIMKIYSHFGFNEFIVALGYRGEYVKNYFLNQRYIPHDFSLDTKTGSTKIHKHKESIIADNFNITFVDTGQETLPGERIKRIENYIPKEDEHFMVTYGDGLSNINIKELVKFHKTKNTIGTITGVHPRSKYGLLYIDNNKLVTSFTEKPVLNEWVNGGFMVFKRAFFNYLKENEMEHEALKRLVSKKQLSVYPHEGFWHSMDTYPDVDSLNKLWLEDPPWKIWNE